MASNNSSIEKAIPAADALDAKIDDRTAADTVQPLRTLGVFDIISAGWNICNSWAGIAATLALGITQGGTVTVVYGIIVMLFVLGATALSLAELAARYPTAGGQYHWTSILAPAKISRGLSYTCGAINIFGWIAISAGVTIIPCQIYFAIATFYNPSFVVHRWQVFLLYQALNIIIVLYNTVALHRAPWTHDVGFILSIVAFIVITITCLAVSSPKQPHGYVWSTFTNESGWKSDGIVFLIGLVNPNYMYAGIDGAIHLAEDSVNAATAVPWALMSVIVIGFITAFVFTVAMVYSLSDLAAVLAITTGVPVYEIWRQATRSGTAATVFVMVLSIVAIFSLNACQQTSSRLTWSFARDNALIFSGRIKRIHPRLRVPVWALLFNAFIVFVVGCVYLGSSTAFYAMIGTSLVLQQISFAFPAALLMFRRRASRYLPLGRFNLGAFGWVANSIAVAWALLALVLYCLPLSVPPSGGTMNYTSAVLGGIALFSLINWYFYARKHYHGPVIDVEFAR